MKRQSLELALTFGVRVRLLDLVTVDPACARAQRGAHRVVELFIMCIGDMGGDCVADGYGKRKSQPFRAGIWRHEPYFS